MANLGHIGPREREILTAIIETYIVSGEPVGSRTLSRQNKDGLSPATIRNVMADLVDAGFLEQPHTSAGRVPTSQAYRYYVDQISGRATISPADQTLISHTLQGTVDVQEFLERTSHVLSLVSSGVGVAIGSAGPKNALEHVYFSRQGSNRVLAVVVTKAGVVHDRMMRLERDLVKTLEEKERVADLLAAYLDTRQEAVRVVIGLEEAVPEMRNFVLMGAPARVGEEMRGSLAVIGPTRMDYQHTITAVSYIAQLFDKLLNENT